MISCQEPFFKREPKTDRETIFNQVWNDFDRSYPAFEIRKINWDSVYDVYYPRATAATTDDELFKVIESMLLTLKDGHVNLMSPVKTVGHDVLTGRRRNFLGLDVIRPQLSNWSGNRAILYGKLPGNIGYLYVARWSGELEEFEIIKSIIESFSAVKGIIIDVRNNTGGNDANADEISSHFADMKRVTSYVRYKSGPAHDAMGEYIDRVIEPDKKSKKNDVPIIVLTNRACFSANEHFILTMRSFPYVKTLGDTTGGGSSNPMWRELPHGWNYRMPRWLQYDLDKKTFEAVGIFPDYPVWISKADSAAGRDAILEEAIRKLN